ncbi:MAG: hypothetical protein KJ995_05500 [Candidatus Omnitrophica bacterium]|nr:hypothetical protein [Candidatus Omnitrophota bacterium]
MREQYFELNKEYFAKSTSAGEAGKNLNKHCNIGYRGIIDAFDDSIQKAPYLKRIAKRKIVGYVKKPD